MFKDLPEGKTHFENDGCGETAHNDPTPRGWEEEFVEKGAEIEHDRWARWYRWQRDNTTPENIARWNRQEETAYADLSEPEKESDRKETRNYLPLVQQQIEEAENRHHAEKCQRRVFFQEGEASVERRIADKIGFMRQWLNEDRITEHNKMVTNNELLHWLK